MSLVTAETCLKWVLRIIGGVELLAIPFIVLPREGLAFIHEKVLGLGPFPPAPVVDYMARGWSTLYAIHGAMVVFFSFDVARYRPAIRFLGLLHVLLGAAMMAIDVLVAWPWWWTLIEGPGLMLGGLIMIALASQEAASELAHPATNGQ